MLVEHTDLRVAAREAEVEVSEAKRWLLGDYNHGHLANLPSSSTMEMALGFRFTAERFYEIGFLNRLVDGRTADPERRRYGLLTAASLARQHSGT
jgi:enoyl-CoA hydratase/carnithine racemase